MIKIYQNNLSPLKPSCCRFYPSCSQYSIEVFKRFGFFAGCFLTIKRLLKCHPLHSGGLDEPPERFP